MNPATTTPSAVPKAEPVPTFVAQRLVSLDVFRGMTILLMILVNNPGTWSAVYPPLLHAPWHGWTPTDLVFPFFLFIVGVAIVFAFSKRLARGADRGDLVRKTVVRSLILFGLGLVLAAFPFVQFAPEFGLLERLGRLRIMGVLQRIALCYLIASLLFLYTRPRTRALIAVACLLGYWALMMLVPVPGYGAGLIDDPVGNLASYLDRVLLGDHLWAGADFLRDPEGLFSTIPAVVTTLIGVWTGRLLIDGAVEPVDKAARLMLRGFALLAAGWAWSGLFPINKPLWTSSYALFTGGLALLVLGSCYWLIDVRGHVRWTRPFVLYGVNAITVFFLSGVLAKSLTLIPVPDGQGGTHALQSALFDTVFAPLGPPRLASLLYALTWVAGWYLVLAWMYRRRIVIRV